MMFVPFIVQSELFDCLDEPVCASGFNRTSRSLKISTGCSGKIVFFHNSLQPLPRLNRYKGPPKLSTQYECTVRWLTFENSWKKTQYLTGR